MGHTNTILMFVTVLTTLPRSREERHRKLVIRPDPLTLLISAHYDTNSNSASMDACFFTPSANFLPSMPASFVEKLRDILTGDDHSSIGDLDVMQSITARKVARISIG